MFFSGPTVSWITVSYTHLRAHETRHDLVCRLLLESVQLTGERLDQDKNWIKSLLKGLLDQQEKFQHLEDRMREREKDSMIRKEADLQHERGWIKVEKAKLRKSEIQESKREQPVSESIF